MKHLCKNEVQKINALLKKSSKELNVAFQEGLKKIGYEFDESFKEEFDANLYTEFLKEFLNEAPMYDKYRKSFNEFFLNENTIDEAILAATKFGSNGITFLISDFLDSIATKKIIQSIDINNILGLIEMRNEMHTAEKDFIKDKYRRYLEVRYLQLSI